MLLCFNHHHQISCKHSEDSTSTHHIVTANFWEIISQATVCCVFYRRIGLICIEIDLMQYRGTVSVSERQEFKKCLLWLKSSVSCVSITGFCCVCTLLAPPFMDSGDIHISGIYIFSGPCAGRHSLHTLLVALCAMGAAHGPTFVPLASSNRENYARWWVG